MGKIRILRPPLPRLSRLNKGIPLEITIDVQFSKTLPPPGKPDVLNGWPLIVSIVLNDFVLLFKSTELWACNKNRGISTDRDNKRIW